MKFSLKGARPPLVYTLPRLNRGVLGTLRCIAPLYLRGGLGIRIQTVHGAERLIEEYRRFEQGESLLILAFRHIHPDDAQAMFTLLNNRLPAIARRRGVRLRRRPHAHFLYGRGVPLWKGRWLTWLFSRVGGIPVARNALVRNNIDLVRQIIVEGQYPLALAPEAQVTYHNGIVRSLEPGFAQFAVWGLRDTLKRGNAKQIRILPVALHYRYGRKPEEAFRKVITAIEQRSGLRVPKARWDLGFTEVLGFVGGAVLDICEGYYRRVYGLMPLRAADNSGETEAEYLTETPGDFTRQRVEALTNAVLGLLERRLPVPGRRGTFLGRILAVRQAGWDWIFRRGVDRPLGESPLQSALEDYTAAETQLLLRHLEVTDVLSYMVPEYALESGDANRAVETALNLHDLLGRLQGGTIGERMRIRPTFLEFHIGAAAALDGSELQEEKGERQLREQVIGRIWTEFARLSGDGA